LSWRDRQRSTILGSKVESFRGLSLKQTKYRKGKMKIRIMNKLVAAGLVMLAVGQSCSFAAGPGFVGINYGPYHRPGQSPDAQSKIQDDQFQADLSVIAQKYSYIRTYGVEKAGRMDQLVPFIENNFPSMTVYLGVYESNKWPGETQAQLETAIALANKYSNIIECMVVGNECLDQDFAGENAVSIDKLIQDIKTVKSQVPPHVKVTTCFGFQSGLNPKTYADGSPNPYWREGKDYGKRVMTETGADFLMFTVYPFYGKEDIKNAQTNTKYWYDYAVKNIANGKPVILGEVGWPSAGKPDNGAAVSSVENEKKYTTDMTNAVKNGQLGSTFLFEAFDEPWKKGNQWETYWGLWDQNGNPKFDIPSGH